MATNNTTAIKWAASSENWSEVKFEKLLQLQ